MRIMLLVLAVLALSVAPVYAQVQADPATEADPLSQADPNAVDPNAADPNASQGGLGPNSETNPNAGVEADPLGASEDDQQGDIDASATGDAADSDSLMAGNEIQATVSSIDHVKGELKINEAGGAERTFQFSNTQDLQNIQAGDQVKITADPNDPNKAQSVEKAEDASQPLM